MLGDGARRGRAGLPGDRGPPFRLASGATHDGMQLVDLCPMGMTFVRSRDGVSPDEWSSREDCGAGAEVLYRVVLDLASGD